MRKIQDRIGDGGILAECRQDGSFAQVDRASAGVSTGSATLPTIPPCLKACHRIPPVVNPPLPHRLAVPPRLSRWLSPLLFVLLASALPSALWSGTAWAADSMAVQEPRLALSLADARRLWQEHSRELRLSRIAVSGADADRITAGQAPNPQLSVNVGSVSPWEGVGAGSLRNKRMDSVFRLEQLVERGNKRELRTKVAEAQLEATRRLADDVARQQYQTLIGAYYDLKLAESRLQVLSETAQLYREGVTASERRLKAGDIARSELARFSVEAVKAENDRRQAEADRAAAQVALAYLIGRDAEAAQLRTADDWPPLGQPLPTADAATLAARPDVAAARARSEAAEQARELARSLRTRDVTVGVQFEHNVTNPPLNSYGVGVSVPLFLRYSYEGEIARAEADLSAAREDQARIEATALGEVNTARAAALSAEARRSAAEAALLPDAERVAKAAEYAYKRGAAGLIDLLDARRTLRQSQQDVLQARNDHARALAAYRAALGQGAAEAGRNAPAAAATASGTQP